MASETTSIPRFRAPIAMEKVRRAPAPPTVYELLESSTAFVPEDIPGLEIGSGIGVKPAADAAVDAIVAAPPPRKRAVADKITAMADDDAAADDGAVPRRRVAVAAPPPALPVGDSIMPDAYAALDERIKAVVDRPKVQIKEDAYVPSTRKFFKQFIIQAYRRYTLPRLADIPDPDACAKAAESSKKGVKTFAYQSFVRDYIQKPTPYRGVLVYHGLGSGKTCTSIAAMEALYQFDKSKPIYIMTPAALSPNYRDEITKCGPFVFRTNNHWRWISVPSLKERTPEAVLLVERLGVPVYSIRKRKGGWLPDPTQAANFDSLRSDQQQQIRDQITEHIDSRIQFIHYNGLKEERVRQWACKTPHMFDGATVIIDEAHNIVRTINNADLETQYKTEPRNSAQYDPRYCNVGHKYKISYLVYRLLAGAVGCKIIALSATPIINFPQEIGILANLLGGDTRMAEVNVSTLERRKEMLRFLQSHPEIDFAEVVPRPDANVTTLRITPVPSGCRKVIDPATGEFRGFVRNEQIAGAPEEIARERALDEWFGRVRAAFSAAGFAAMGAPTFSSVTRLPDTEKEFREKFINTDELEVKRQVRLPLMARLSGLISYYKGGKADLMARVGRDEEVFVDMSDLQLQKYTDQRVVEIEREIKQQKKDKKKPAAAAEGAPGGRVGYADVTTIVNSTFKIFSRAACNFVFPGEMERPIPANYRDVMKMVGARPGQAADADILTSDVVVDVEEAPAVVAEEEEVVAAAGPGAAVAVAEAAEESEGYQAALVNAVRELRAHAAELFGPGALAAISPKFQAICDRVAVTPGPALVYSNFKTLEGVGLFGVALEAQLGYKKFDIVKTTTGEWTLSPETLTAGPGTPRYITYTGDEEREKRRALLDIFNNKWNKLPGKLVKQVKDLTGASNNLHGEIARVFMITQSGAEGISLSNVRQVHIMEPYWNYVRLDQVKGRAIRICSHMDLPPEERVVDVFTYISRFSKRQRDERKVIETLLNHDGGKTTDESILELMKSKKKLADSILDVMKSSAVDCELNATENGALSCYRFAGTPSINEFMFHPLVDVHIREAAAAQREVA